MLFDTNISAAIKCMHCGKLAIEDVSFFDLGRDGNYHGNCECGHKLFRIKSSDCKTFRIYVPCSYCEKEHTYVFSSRQVLSEKVKILGCPVSRVDLAFVGNRKLVREVAEKLERDLQELINVLEL